MNLWHRLSLEMGIPICELKSRMPMSEFWAWIAYDRIRPIGTDRVDILLSKIITTLYAKGGVKSNIYDHAFWLDDRESEKLKEDKIKDMKHHMAVFVAVHNKKYEDK